MLDTLFSPIFAGSFTVTDYLLCTFVSLFLGILIALAAGFRSGCSRSFLLTLILLPPIVQTVIMLVNGNIGTGVAVAGAFSLVRFRSAPGSAREIAGIFLAMAAGFAAAVGYIGIAVLFTLILCAVLAVFSLVIGLDSRERELRITVPESLNYAHAFDDIFAEFAPGARLVSAKTTNMGSLYRLRYTLRMKDPEREKEMMDALRCRNGNLEIQLGIAAQHTEEL